MKYLSNQYCQNGRNKRVCLCDPARGIFNHIAADQKTVAERKWTVPKLAPKPQQACDHGLFSDDANQLDLIDKLRS